MTVTAGGDIVVEELVAGQYDSRSGGPAGAAGGRRAGATSRGDVTLIAGGSVYEASDPQVDLVANRVTIIAGTGISAIEFAVNELVRLYTAQGSIDLTEFDGAGEVYQGLLVTDVAAPHGSVTITAEESLEIVKVVATGTDATLRLKSTDGSLVINQPATGEAIEYVSGVSLQAGDSLFTYKYFDAPQFVEHIAGDDFDFNGDAAGDGLPETLNGQNVTIGRRMGLSLSRPLTVNAERFEIASFKNIYLPDGILSGNIGTLVLTAYGEQPVYSQVYDEATGQMVWRDELSGYVNLQSLDLPGDKKEIRALRGVNLDAPGDVTLRGFIGGLTGLDRTGSVKLRTPGTLTVAAGIVSADLVQVDVGRLDANEGSVFLANRIEVTAEGDILLGTVADTITAAVKVAGNIRINEANALTLERLRTRDGWIHVTANGDLTALDVVALTDGAGKDITLESNANLYVNYVDAGMLSGAERSASQVTLDAFGTIREPAGYVDNGYVGQDEVAGQVPTDAEGNPTTEGTTMVDVAAWRINFRHGQPLPDPTLIADQNSRGTTDELEILVTDGTLGTTDDATKMIGSAIPETVDGDYVLYAPDYTGDITLRVTGTLIVALLPTFPGQNINLQAGEHLTSLHDLHVGSGTVTINTAEMFAIMGSIAARSLTLTAQGLYEPLATAVDTLEFHITGPNQDFTVDEQDDLTITAGTMNDGDVTINSGGAITMPDGAVVTAGGGDVRFFAPGNVTIGEILTTGTVVLVSFHGAALDADAGPANDITAGAGDQRGDGHRLRRRAARNVFAAGPDADGRVGDRLGRHPHPQHGPSDCRRGRRLLRHHDC